MKVLLKYLIILGVVGAVVVGFIFLDEPQNDDHNKVNSDVKRKIIKELHNKKSIASKEPGDTEKRYEMNFTPKELEQRLNEEAEKLEVSAGNISFKVQEGKKENLAVYHLNNYLVLTAAIDKQSNKIKNLVLFRSGEIEAEGLTEFYKIAAVIMNVFNPEMTKTDRGKLLFEDLNASQVITQAEFIRKKRYKGLNYTIEYSKGILEFAVTTPNRI
ncbi:hypothetical protein MOC99_10250 [Bacillus haynesii]|uniref:hypothetical protein n=1 Tax=Bacillus haynesii TaxID=1925021 RepID=UPI00227F990F|nr:hypothetical protein [Bacillus haynesii]MCY7769629.1 hypothetical protein [Bacillus haynesii]MCY8013210.1 hypothetical protein [Bacillus haynesii]MCY8350236.1 hypothetical protein [Bacillus haynesii]MEC0785106.1 hypothetical protein [Bacillus haynesii]